MNGSDALSVMDGITLLVQVGVLKKRMIIHSFSCLLLEDVLRLEIQTILGIAFGAGKVRKAPVYPLSHVL
jgi:hypothetical protein